MGTKSMPFLILSCVLLTACATREEIAAKKAAAEQMAQAGREKHCATFGYQPGTPAYSKCLENLYVQDQQLAAVEEANRQARLQAAATSLQQAGAALQSISPPPPPPPQPMFSPPVRCSTIGTTTTCQ
jgi:hypothetical protein